MKESEVKKYKPSVCPDMNPTDSNFEVHCRKKRKTFYFLVNALITTSTLYNIYTNSEVINMVKGNTIYIKSLYGIGLVELPHQINTLLNPATSRKHTEAFGNVFQLNYRNQRMMGYDPLMCENIGLWKGSTESVETAAELTNLFTGDISYRIVLLGHSMIPKGCNATVEKDILNCTTDREMTKQITLAWNTVVKSDDVSGCSLETFTESCVITTLNSTATHRLYKLKSKDESADCYQQYEMLPKSFLDYRYIVEWIVSFVYIYYIIVGLLRFFLRGKANQILTYEQPSTKEKIAIYFTRSSSYGAAYWLNCRNYLIATMVLSFFDLRHSYARTETALYVYMQGKTLNSMVYLAFTISRYSWLSLALINIIRIGFSFVSSKDKKPTSRKWLRRFQMSWVGVSYSKLNVVFLLLLFTMLSAGIDNFFKVKQIWSKLNFTTAATAKATNSEVIWNTILYVLLGILSAFIVAIFTAITNTNIDLLQENGFIRDLVDSYGIIGFNFQELCYQAKEGNTISTPYGTITCVSMGNIIDMYSSISLFNNATIAGLECFVVPCENRSKEIRPWKITYEEAVSRSLRIDSKKRLENAANVDGQNTLKEAISTSNVVQHVMHVAYVDSFRTPVIHLVTINDFFNDIPKDDSIFIHQVDGLHSLKNEDLYAILNASKYMCIV